MKKLGLMIIILSLTYGLIALQDNSAMYYRGETNSWGGTAMSYDEDLDIWKLTILYDGENGSPGFKFADSVDDWDVNWGLGSGISTNTSSLLHPGWNNITIGQTNGRYYNYCIYDVDPASDTYIVVQELTAAPSTISSITEPATVYQDETQTITVSLSGTKLAEEYVYLCYTTDNWSTRKVTEATGSGSSYSVTIPRQNIGTTVKYYAMTTSVEYLTEETYNWGENEALFTLDREYSEANPASYTVSDHNNETYHTVLIDGQNDFSTASERTSGSGSENYWWYTWDESNFYFAIQQGAIADGDAAKSVILYLDTDPQMDETTGTGSLMGVTYNTQQPALPFSANYHFRWDTSGTNFQLFKYTDSWNSVAHTMQAFREGVFFEVSIPLSELDSPDQMYLCGCMIKETGGEEWSWTFTPADASSLADNAEGYEPDLDSYWAFELTSGETPNNSGNEDNPLPVTLTSFSASYDNQGAVLNWSTASEINNSGWNLYRAATENQAESVLLNLELIPGAGTTTATSHYSYRDPLECAEGSTCYYWLESVDYASNAESFGPIALKVPVNEEEEEDTPYSWELYGLQENYPNPFNPQTTISFMLNYASEATVTVYDLRGRKLKTLMENNPVDENSMQYLSWDGKTESGDECGSGVYFYRLITDREIRSRKMILIR